MQNNSSSNSFIFRRAAAFLYDTLLLTAIYFVLTTIAIAFNDGQAIQNGAYYFLLYGVGCLFFSWFWRHGGQTLGMQAWRIKVVGETDEKLSYKQCAVRYISGSTLFIIALLTAWLDSDGRGLHDKWSKSKIVYKNK